MKAIIFFSLFLLLLSCSTEEEEPLDTFLIDQYHKFKHCVDLEDFDIHREGEIGYNYFLLTQFQDTYYIEFNTQARIDQVYAYDENCVNYCDYFIVNAISPQCRTYLDERVLIDTLFVSKE